MDNNLETNLDKGKESNNKGKYAALFIPAGIFLGMGIGFLRSELVAWMFIGMGLGFLLFGFFQMYKR